MADIINMILLQDELPIILTVEISHETEIKGHHVYKDIWTPELGEHLEVKSEQENPVDRFAVCLKAKNGKTVGHLKKGRSGRFAKTISYYLRSHNQANCTAKVSGKRFNNGDGEGLQVPCLLKFTGEKNFICILKDQLNIL